MASRNNRVLTDRDEIRRWAEERNASPACVRGTGKNDDVGILRLDFPGYSGETSLERIDWDEWLDKFEERGLALLVQERTARGQRSNFNKIVSRETARAAGNGRSRSRNASSGARKRTARRTTARTAAKSKSAAKRKSTAQSRSTSTRASRSASASRRTSSARKKQSAGRGRTASAKSATRTRAKSSRSTASSSRKTQGRSASTRSRNSNSANARSNASGRRSSKSRVLTDHDEIRRWAEARKAAPACVRGTGGGDGPGMIRLDFPGFSGARSLERIDWNEWFRAFDDNNLALLVQDTRSGGGNSNFNKLIAREGAARQARSDSKSSPRQSTKPATSRTRAGAANASTKKPVRGSTRAHRTESARGRNSSQRRAA